MAMGMKNTRCALFMDWRMAILSARSSKLECQAISKSLKHLIVHMETYTRFLQFLFYQYFLNPLLTSFYFHSFSFISSFLWLLLGKQSLMWSYCLQPWPASIHFPHNFQDLKATYNNAAAPSIASCFLSKASKPFDDSDNQSGEPKYFSFANQKI